MVCRSLYYTPVVTINILVFCVTTPYILVHRNLCFGATCCLQFHSSPTNVAYREDNDSTDTLVYLYLTIGSHMSETGNFIIT